MTTPCLSTCASNPTPEGEGEARMRIKVQAERLVEAEQADRPGEIDRILPDLEAALRAGPPSREAFVLAIGKGSERLLALLFDIQGSDRYRSLVRPHLRIDYAYFRMLQSGNIGVMRRLADAGILTRDDVIAIADYAASSDHPAMLKLAAQLLPDGQTLTSWIPAPILVEPCGPRIAPLLARDLIATPLPDILSRIRGSATLRWKTTLAIALAHPGEKIAISSGMVQDTRSEEVILRSQSAHGRLSAQARSRSLVSHLAYAGTTHEPA